MKTIIYNLSFLGVLNSPFRGLKLKWYFGDIEHGTPYFLPRKWVKNKPVPIKYFGFNFTTLGWKTKWEDYRFEWSPSISLVIFGKQLFIEIVPNIKTDDSIIAMDCYWEAWLNYKYKLYKTKSIKERIEELQKVYSCTWGNEEKGYTNYYPIILKNKYHYLISENKS